MVRILYFAWAYSQTEHTSNIINQSMTKISGLCKKIELLKNDSNPGYVLLFVTTILIGYSRSSYYTIYNYF